MRIKKQFRTFKRVIQYKSEPLTRKELNKIIWKHKPKEIYHTQWNEQKPFIVITEYLENSFMLYCNGHADKTPDSFDSELLYDFLIIQGLEDCYIIV